MDASVFISTPVAPTLMVAEKNGTIRFYDLFAQQAILSLESEQDKIHSTKCKNAMDYKIHPDFGDVNKNTPMSNPSSWVLYPLDLASPGIELSLCVSLEETTSLEKKQRLMTEKISSGGAPRVTSATSVAGSGFVIALARQLFVHSKRDWFPY
ncbi:hypothetical protein P7K49_020128 [Saguinus oedipus]|uniref:Uncharacterized protein n=1 Tax=Saguinus oedipus TaxID=9490 RepID=A0ABQ9UZE0_SAGOE|nr:hypothetical protein P7K49_020128 [Saguinus oedipus]